MRPFARDAVEVRRLEKRVAGDRHAVPAHVVHEDEDDVRTVGGSRPLRRSKQREKDKQPPTHFLSPLERTNLATDGAPIYTDGKRGFGFIFFPSVYIRALSVANSSSRVCRDRSPARSTARLPARLRRPAVPAARRGSTAPGSRAASATCSRGRGR